MVAIGQLAAWLCTGSSARRWAGLGVCLATLLPPWFAAPSVVRGFYCLGAALALMRLVDLFRDHRIHTAAQRSWHAVSPVDSRRLHHAPAAFDGKALGGAAAWVVASAGGLWLASLAGGSPLGWLLRWTGGLVSVYAFVCALWTGAGGLYRLAGFSVPTLHDNPIASLSVRELWGERWSRPVSGWLHANVFRPLARRGWPRLGLVAAFLTSAALHAYAVWVSAGLPMAGIMLAYFFVQGLLVLVERLIGVQRWRPAAAHVWVVGVMLLTSPLFVEPFLQAVGIRGPMRPW